MATKIIFSETVYLPSTANTSENVNIFYISSTNDESEIKTMSMQGNASEQLVLVDYINTDINQRKFVLRAKADFKYKKPQTWYLSFNVCFEKDPWEVADP